MKIMISQPMRGLSTDEILSARKPYLDQFKKLKVEVVNTVFIPSPKDLLPVNTNPVFCLSRAIALMSDCNAVFFMPGWEKARGCQIERQICTAYGIPILDTVPTTKELTKLEQPVNLV